MVWIGFYQRNWINNHLPKWKAPGPDGFVKEETIPVLSSLFQRLEAEEYLTTYSVRQVSLFITKPGKDIARKEN